MRNARIDRILSLIDSVLDSQPEPTAEVVVQRTDGTCVVVPFPQVQHRDFGPAA